MIECLFLPFSKLELLFKVDADFSAKEPCLNCCGIAPDNLSVATGGDDGVVRIFKLAQNLKSVEGEVVELTGPTGAINSIDISHDGKRLVATSKDCHAHIFDLATKKAIQKLSFKYSPGVKNMDMRSAFFRRNNEIYTLSSLPRKPAFVIRWSPYRDTKLQGAV